jgi:hypothetical protein
MSPDELLAHFRGPREVKFFVNLSSASDELIASANRIVDRSLLAFAWFRGTLFRRERFNGRRRSAFKLRLAARLSSRHQLMRADGSDVRVLWELNRLGHFLTLADAYSLTDDERYAAEFFAQLQSWIEQNPYGRGPNWTCAMEVALRAMNLLGRV